MKRSTTEMKLRQPKVAFKTKQKQQTLKETTTYIEDKGAFDHNSPRPPVPGEERAHSKSDWNQMEWNRPRVTSSLARKGYEPCIPMGFEPEGNCKSSSRSTSRHDRLIENRSPDNPSPLPCLQWAKSLYNLLEDPDGVELFKKYLQSEGRHHADALDFWFACEGLRKQSEPERVQQLIKAIYRRFVSALPIADELRREVGKAVKTSPLSESSVALFDEAQLQIETLINNTTYPNFLKSDMYLHYVQSVHNPNGSNSDFSSESSSSSSSVSTRELANLAAGIGPLPIIHEDMEFIPPSSAALGLTPGTGCMSTGYQTPNLGTNVRLTKDMLLVTQKHRAMDVRPKPEAYADDGKSICRSSRRKTQEARQARESAALNKETHLYQTVIPRPERMDIRQCRPMNPQQFAAILIEKLEKVKKDRESQELLDRKLKESRELANAIREKFQLDDDNDQDILDQHVSRVFSDQTASSIKSPRSYSPTRNRWQTNYMRPRRKDKDGFSTFSSDSGNVHDFPEGSDHKTAMVKSKSMPEYADERFVRGSVSRRSSSKKTLTDLTDSGVSVVSDTPPATHGVPTKEHRVLAWLMDSNTGSRSTGYTHSEMSAKHRGHRSSSATSPNASRHRKGHGSRSSSLERSSAASSLGPAQPFVADPNMPPLPSPNTAIQLEEARRRLSTMEDDSRTRSRQRNSSKYLPDMSQSTQSTLRKSMRGSRPIQSTTAPEDVTTVMFTFCDEQFPYRTKIPGKQVTLRQFKDYLPKKGNYRYFFKTECEELNNQVIQEEICNDSEILPTYDGKQSDVIFGGIDVDIRCQVENVDVRRKIDVFMTSPNLRKDDVCESTLFRRLHDVT
ncbi:Axin beta-catenin binding motif [Popillia japonica]|uniref:Axin beta-catenin binding motif n=1 Tax=Popillia japonica TaxID=7064 RepID=A0AAW1LUM3_POPJA